MKSKISNNFAETQHIGKEFVLRSKILLRRTQWPIVICLYGELGAGKTTFVQGLARGLGIKNRIISPTFIFIRRYDLRFKNKDLRIKYFYHIDLYRIEDQKGIEGLGLEEILSDENSIVVIEWAEKLGSKLPKNRIDIYFENLEENKRKITWSK